LYQFLISLRVISLKAIFSAFCSSSKVYVVRCADGREWLSVIPKKVETLKEKLDIKSLLPQNLGR
jgi:hypothetical protein